MRDILGETDPGRNAADGMGAARRHAGRALPKRFYAQVTVGTPEGGLFSVLLDGKPIRTPARNRLALPSEAIARMIADEFAAQSEHVDPKTMPATRLVNSAIDGVAANRQSVIDDILRFAASDLICYRAEGPERLCEIQSEAWDPVLHWAEKVLGARFLSTAGIVHVEQPREALDALAATLDRHGSPLALAAIHSMTTLTGSALLALAVAEKALDAEAAWKAAHVDEDWNIAQWGEDFEAAERRRSREAEMLAAAAILAGGA